MVSRVSLNFMVLGLAELWARSENFGIHNRHFILAFLLRKCYSHGLSGLRGTYSEEQEM